MGHDNLHVWLWNCSRGSRIMGAATVMPQLHASAMWPARATPLKSAQVSNQRLPQLVGWKLLFMQRSLSNSTPVQLDGMNT